jgi:hypothetical protein
VYSYFLSIRFRPTEADPNLFIRKGVNSIVYILLYVDDILIVGQYSDIDTVKAEITRKWKSKDLGPATIFIGFQIYCDRSARTIDIY